ncbi:MAG: peptidoglycan bridge formation glycyltransferase FemA/FemB family protein [Patescibacteria group bacterium]|nr:peptidoglycan bridge formation glycyltransferase FemA/FemB family protein [Patescibacteria group bacterium]
MTFFQKIDDKKEWQDLLDKILFKTFFHNLEWEEFLEKEFKWLKFKRYLWRDQALLSLAQVKIFGKEKLVSHPFCEYGGLLPLAEQIAGDNFQQDLFREFESPLRVNFHPQILKFFNVTSSTRPGLVDSEIDTYFIEDYHRKTVGQIWDSFRETLRHSIKKAQNRGLEIEKCEKEKDLRSFYNLYIKKAKIHRVPAYPFSFLQFFWRSPDGEIILAKHNGRVIAGSCFLFYNKFIHYFLNASNDKYKNFYPNHLILWTQIQKYVGRNFEVFDLGGTGRNSLLEIFKSGWGTKKYPIFELSNFSKEKSFRKSKLRDIFALLPDFLIKKLSSYLLKYKL